MRKLVRRVLDLGIEADTPLDFAVATRAANLSAIFMAIVAVLSTLASLVSARNPALALACLALGLVYAVSLLLSAAGRLNAARWVFLVAAAWNYVQVNVALGTASGAAFWIVALLGYPVIAYARVERRQVAFVYVLLGVLFVTTDLLTRLYGPLVLDPQAQIVAYYFQLVTLSAVVGFGFYYYKNSSVAARADLDAAHDRIAELLDNMLPTSIVKRLEHGERVIADSHGEASVLFADLTGFSVLTRRLSPTHLVEVLNRMFSRFDEAAARHAIEKIKTIGDCYMAATGVLDDDQRHAGIDAMAEFALEMLAIVESVARELGVPLGVRVGISTGSVVSGVIGTRRYNFDVWGDTVNLASQMESTGVVGRIQVSEATYWRLHTHYRFEPRGDIEVKSGQRVPTYLLVGRLAGAEVSIAGDPLLN